jgi:hypothetical protein
MQVHKTCKNPTSCNSKGISHLLCNTYLVHDYYYCQEDMLQKIKKGTSTVGILLH